MSKLDNLNKLKEYYLSKFVHEVNTYNKGKHYFTTGRASDLNELYIMAHDFRINHVPKNESSYLDVVVDDRDRSHFFGFTGDDWVKEIKNPNITKKAFYSQRNKLNQLGLDKKLAPVFQNITPKRKRALSEHEGDWDYDRRFDLEQYETTKKINAGDNSLHLRVLSSFNANASDKEITEYLTTCLYLAELIEGLGIKVKLSLEFCCAGGYSARDKRNCHNRVTLQAVVKDYHNYGETSDYATCFNVAFFRRSRFFFYVIEGYSNDYYITNSSAEYYVIKPEEHGELVVTTHTINNLIHGDGSAMIEGLTKSLNYQSWGMVDNPGDDSAA